MSLLLACADGGLVCVPVFAGIFAAGAAAIAWLRGPRSE